MEHIFLKQIFPITLNIEIFLCTDITAILFFSMQLMILLVELENFLNYEHSLRELKLKVTFQNEEGSILFFVFPKNNGNISE